MTTPDHFQQTKTARAAILNDLKERSQKGDKAVKPMHPDDSHRWHKPQDSYFYGAGTMKCPVCERGTLCYSRSGYNGHVHARCSTEGCVAWME